MTEQQLSEPVRILRHVGRVVLGPTTSSFTLENRDDPSRAEVVLDYQQCKGGIPIFEIASVSGDAPVEVKVVYSEGIEGIDHDTGKQCTLLRRDIFADGEQVTDPSFCFPMPWTPTGVPL